MNPDAYLESCDKSKKSVKDMEQCPEFGWARKYEINGECPPCARESTTREREEEEKSRLEKEVVGEGNGESDGVGGREQDVVDGDGDDEDEVLLRKAIEKELRMMEQGKL